MIVAYIVAVVVLVLTGLFNRVIGDGDLRERLHLNRFWIYIATGLMAGVLSSIAGFDYVTAILTGLVVGIGYAIYRQPGPDIVFYAGRRTQGTSRPDAIVIRWILEKVHGVDPWIWIKTDVKARTKAGVLAGMYRGMYIFPMTYGLSLIYGGQVIWFSLLGGLMGVIYKYCSYLGPWKSEHNFVMRAEVVTGMVIVAMNFIGPILLGVYL